MLFMEGTGRLVTAIADGHDSGHGVGTNMVVTYCAAGTKVWVYCRDEFPVTCSIHAGYEGAEEHLNTFSGVLLAED